MEIRTKENERSVKRNGNQEELGGDATEEIPIGN